MMEVKIGNYGSIQIGHADLFGKANDMDLMGNPIRQAKGLEMLSVKEFLRREDVWCYIAELELILSKGLDPTQMLISRDLKEENTISGW